MERAIYTNGELEKVAPFNRMGAWITNHRIHYFWAKKYYSEFERLNTEYINEKENIINEFGEEQSYLDAIIHGKLSEKEEELDMLSNCIVLFSCMAIEGFLNYYGVRRLGENFYKRNIERLGITEKLQLILLSCTGYLSKKDDKIIKTIRVIFDLRNSLIHPKSKDLTVKGISNLIYGGEFSEEEVMNMLDEFFKLFLSYDEDIKIETDKLKIGL